MTVAETIENMSKHFNPTAAAGLNKTIQLNISGDQGGSWQIKIANQSCTTEAGVAEKPDLTLNVKDSDWLDMLSGKISPMSAFMGGKLKTSGDMMLAMNIPKLFNLQ